MPLVLSSIYGSIQFDELPKPIEEMTFQELHDFSGQKLKNKLASKVEVT